jgi:Asp/Glu/hydantoin racemase
MSEIEDERLPVQEGWRPSQTPITQSTLNMLVLKLIWANSHKNAEALSVGLGTMSEIKDKVAELFHIPVV